MCKKSLIFCCIVSMALVISSVPSYAAVEANSLGSTRMHAPNWPAALGTPKVMTTSNPNELPSYNEDPGSGTLRIAENFIDGRGVSQTFTMPDGDGFTLSNIVIRAGGAGSTTTGLYTLHLFDTNANGPDMPGSYTPGTQYISQYPGPDFFGSIGFYGDPCLMVDANGDQDALVGFTFSGYDRVDLEPNHMYAFEIWGASNVTGYPFLWIRYGTEDKYLSGNGFECPASRTPTGGGAPGPSNLNNYRSRLSGLDRDTVMAVYGVAFDGNAYHPNPRKYQTGVSLNPTLSWKPGKWADDTLGHQVWFGKRFDRVTSRHSAVNMGRVTEPNFTPAGPLELNTIYYWRVDEYNDVNIPLPPLHPDGNYYWGVDSELNVDKPTVYQFTSLSPQAYGPVPATGTEAEFNVKNIELRWTPGALVASTAGHKVYFGTDYAAVLAATEANTNNPELYFGAQDACAFALSNIEPNYKLTAGATYYWRIDEVNGASTWPGEVWNFRMPSPAYIVIDNFQSYGTSQAALNQVWQTGYKLNYTPPPAAAADGNTVGGAISIISGQLSLYYENASGNLHGPWSEAKLDYNNVTADWEALGFFDSRILSVQYDGDGNNDNTGNTVYAANPAYDVMYVAIEDSLGRFGMATNTDLAAPVKKNIGMRNWWIDLATLTSPNNVDLGDINRMYLGFGIRGSWEGYAAGSAGSYRKGTVLFDDIRLYPKHCVPSKAAALPGDFVSTVLGNNNPFSVRDCVVNLYDLDYFVNTLNGNENLDLWLLKDTDINYIGSTQAPPDINLLLWYKFDETSPSANAKSIADSALLSVGPGTVYVGHPEVAEPFTWQYPGHTGTGRCLNLEPGYRTWVEVPPAAYSPSKCNGGATISWWEDFDMNYQPDNWASVFMMHIQVGADDTATNYNNTQMFETQLPTPRPPSHDWGPQMRWVTTMSNGTAGVSIGPLGSPWRKFSDFSGQWNHYALVFNDAADKGYIYLNGKLVADNNVTEPLWVDPNLIRIGTRSNRPTYPHAGFWHGKLDDFKIYNYALSENEIKWLATDGTGLRDMPFQEPLYLDLNMKKGDTPEIVNFKDFAMWAQNWLSQTLWPNP